MVPRMKAHVCVKLYLSGTVIPHAMHRNLNYMNDTFCTTIGQDSELGSQSDVTTN